MGAKRYKLEAIIPKLREAEVLLTESGSVGEIGVGVAPLLRTGFGFWRARLAMVISALRSPGYNPSQSLLR